MENIQIALVIPPAVIKQYEKQYNAKITQKNYKEGLKEHGVESDNNMGPTGWIEKFNNMAEKKKITLYTKDLPSKYHTYHALFHELQHASSTGYDDKRADAFAEQMLKEKGIKKYGPWSKNTDDGGADAMMWKATEAYQKRKSLTKKP